MFRYIPTTRAHSWLITGFVTRLIQRVPLVYNIRSTFEAETTYPSGAPEFTPGFWRGSSYSVFSFMGMCCRSLFVLLCIFVWPMCCLFFLDIRILITSLWYLLAIVLSVLPRYTDSDYPFGIFKLFFGSIKSQHFCLLNWMYHARTVSVHI